MLARSLLAVAVATAVATGALLLPPPASAHPRGSATKFEALKDVRSEARSILGLKKKKTRANTRCLERGPSISSARGQRRFRHFDCYVFQNNWRRGVYVRYHKTGTHSFKLTGKEKACWRWGSPRGRLFYPCASPPPKPKPPPPPPPPPPLLPQGDFIITYVPSENPDVQSVIDGIKETEWLDFLARYLNEKYVLREDIRVYIQEGTLGPAYFHGARTITMPPEFLEAVTSLFHFFTGPAKQARQAFAFVFLHEAGHALIDQLELPVTGLEEDAADQFATMILTALGVTKAGH